MGSGRQSADKSIGILDDFLSEIESYALEDVPVKSKKSKKKKIDNLDDRFWQTIRSEIAAALVSNYNNIRIMNSPEYYNWKARAREKGLEIEVTEDGGKAKVLYVRPALRTGTLRERLKNVEVVRKRITAKNVTPESLTFTVELDDLKNDYGNKISERFGKDILALDEEQLNEILEKIISHYEQG